MLSCNALKYRIVVQRSFYAGLAVTGLYSSLILLILVVFNLSWITFPFLIALLVVAFYGGRKAFMQHYVIKLSEVGDIEISFNNGDYIPAQINPSSFYNSLFLSLHLQKKISLTINNMNTIKRCHSNILIFKDTLSGEEYRLLARIINSKRD